MDPQQPSNHGLGEIAVYAAQAVVEHVKAACPIPEPFYAALWRYDDSNAVPVSEAARYLPDVLTQRARELSEAPPTEVLVDFARAIAIDKVSSRGIDAVFGAAGVTRLTLVASSLYRFHEDVSQWKPTQNASYLAFADTWRWATSNESSVKLTKHELQRREMTQGFIFMEIPPNADRNNTAPMFIRGDEALARARSIMKGVSEADRARAATAVSAFVVEEVQRYARQLDRAWRSVLISRTDVRGILDPEGELSADELVDVVVDCYQPMDDVTVTPTRLLSAPVLDRDDELGF